MKQMYLNKVKMLMLLLCSIAVTVAFLKFLYYYDNKYTAKSMIAQDGVCLAPETGVQCLTDGWEFYPDALLSPLDFEGSMPKDKYYRISLGDYPNLSRFHENQNPYGVSTYRLRLRGAGLYSLYMQEPLCAAKVFVGGVSVGENGSVAMENYQPLVKDAVYQFTVDGETELIIQTANYSHYYGGLYYPPALGDAGSISSMIAARMTFYGFLCFTALVLALFSTAVWFGRKGRRDLAAFYFGMLSLSFALRVCYPFLRFWGVPFIRPLYALEDLAALAGIYCVLQLSLLLFTPGLQGRMRTCMGAVSLGMCGVGLIIPLVILPVFPSFTLWYGILLSCYKLLAAGCLVGIALHGIIAGRAHARFSLAAVTAYSVCLIYNIFFINQFEPIRTGWQDEYGSFLLVLLFGAIMVQRSHAMAADNLRLTEHLQEEVDEKTGYLTRLLNERSQLMAELGHDMKSPLASLSNMVQIIRQGNILLDETAQEKIQVMEQRCDDLADRIGSVQRLTTETGGLSEMSRLLLNCFLAEFHREMQPVVEMSGPDFLCELTDVPCLVLANADKLSRALENLVFNAADFTSSDGRIHLTLEQEGSHACISVADNGCGIPADAISKLFDRFYTTRINQGGQGLGLAITKTIILEHRGEVTVESEQGEGTVFAIHLPLLK